MAVSDRDMETLSIRLLRLEAEAVLSCLDERRRMLLAAAAEAEVSNSRVMKLAGDVRTIEEVAEKIERAMARPPRSQAADERRAAWAAQVKRDSE